MLSVHVPRAWAWRPRVVLRHVAAVFLLVFLAASVLLWYDSRFWNAPGLRLAAGGRPHPIRKLMRDARAHHEAVLARRSTDLAAAAARYRRRRGRHPPPGFDRWFRAALDADAVVVEDFFDRIYHDLRPYWALDARTLRRRAAAWHFVVRVRAGKASMKGDVGDRVPWLRLWTELISEFAGSLPDVDMPINYMDESRILLPFDAVADLVRREARDRTMPRADQVAANFSGLRDVDEAGPGQPAYDPAWHGPGEQYWHLAVKACGPHTPAHGVGQGDLSGPAAFPHHYRPSYGYKGYVQNWTAAKDPCLQPHIRQLHGTFIEPISLSSTEELIPLFGGSKLPLNNEILIPGAMYLTKREFYSGGDSHGPSWVRKKDGLIWRGDGSGGRARPHNWQHFHRHRLVDMLNGTSVSLAEAAGGRAMAFELPSGDLDPGFASVGAWLGTFADAAFVHLCPGDRCGFLEDRFAPVKELPMRKQFRYKFLPDADGNSFSARFRGFLRSTSLPLKATIYAEWHDDRLEPWLHFVPLDNTFRDLYAALGFFADGPGRPGDAAARFIAERGRQWAETVLRREDMRLYMWRLLLEWARVCDDRRQLLGFVDDLAEGRTGQ